MRLDIYLAKAHILKSRSLAKDAVDAGMIYINSRTAKAASSVKTEDIIEIDIPRFYKKIRILAIPPKNIKKEAVAGLYQLLEDRKKELL